MQYHVFLRSRKCKVWCVFGHAKVLGLFTIRRLCHSNLLARFRNEYPVPELVAGKNKTDFLIFFSSDLTHVFLLGRGNVKDRTYSSDMMLYRSKDLRINQDTLQPTWRIGNFIKICVCHSGFFQNTSILRYWAISTGEQLQTFRNRHNEMFKKKCIFNWIVTLP